VALPSAHWAIAILVALPWASTAGWPAWAALKAATLVAPLAVLLAVSEAAQPAALVGALLAVLGASVELAQAAVELVAPVSVPVASSLADSESLRPLWGVAVVEQRAAHTTALVAAAPKPVKEIGLPEEEVQEEEEEVAMECQVRHLPGLAALPLAALAALALEPAAGCWGAEDPVTTQAGQAMVAKLASRGLAPPALYLLPELIG